MPFSCYVSWKDGVSFNLDELSNNHLVTDRADLRRTLAGVHVGDQIHFRGWLVNYRDARYAEGWRRSSTVRTDTGNGACEVVFFDRLEVLARHAPVAYALRGLLPWVAAALLLGILGLAATRDPTAEEIG
jgi:hypothetical protein